MEFRAIAGYVRNNVKVILFFVCFAVGQFVFFFGLCHLMPGDRLYQRKAKILAGKSAPTSISDHALLPQVHNFESESGHRRQILAE